VTSRREPDPFECCVEPRRDVVYVSPLGELDIATATEVETRLQEIRAAGFDRLILDLHETTFIDSTGLHLVLDWHERARRERFAFALIRGPDAVQRVFEASGIASTLRFLAR
jgi:anti-sigma B factor antagonist